MKKLFLATCIAVFLCATTFAVPVKTVTYNVSNSFKRAYPGVTKVEWTVCLAYAKATFDLNNVRTEAFYTADGELIGTSQCISIDDLPTEAKRKFAKHFGDHTVREAIQFETSEGSSYFVSAEKDNRLTIVRISDGTISTFKPGSKM